MPLPTLQPFWTSKDGSLVKLYQGDALTVLKRLPSNSVNMCVTSPPYWGLRDYKTAQWVGGKRDCDHIEHTAVKAHKSSTLGIAADGSGRRMPATNAAYQALLRQFAATCGKCGAKRVDQQLGSEPTPEEFVANLVAVFREVRRVLHPTGTLWLNIGGGYLSGGQMDCTPWRVALALQRDGWVFRQDIIWHKVCPMPESVTNRCTKAHEYIFLFAKQQRYFFDNEAIRERTASEVTPEEYEELLELDGSVAKAGIKGPNGRPDVLGTGRKHGLKTGNVAPPGGRNKRSVWSMASGGYAGAHFATYPPKLIEPCILAGTSAHGCCAKCGAPYTRIVESTKLARERPNDYVKRQGVEGTGNSCANTVAGVATKTLGWKAGCNCGASVVPCTVLDPFCGSGTTCCVSALDGRRSIGIDLSETYLKQNAIPRITGALWSVPAIAMLMQPLPNAFKGGARCA